MKKVYQRVGLITATLFFSTGMKALTMQAATRQSASTATSVSTSVSATAKPVATQSGQTATSRAKTTSQLNTTATKTPSQPAKSSARLATSQSQSQRSSTSQSTSVTPRPMKLTAIKITGSRITGHAVAGAQLQVFDLQQRVLGTTNADKRGNFVLNVKQKLTTVPVTLRATRANYRPVSWQSTARFKLTKVQVTKRRVSGKAVAGAKVQLINDRQHVVGTATANARGAFKLSATTKTTGAPFTLRATKPRYHAVSWQYRAPLKLTKLKVTRHQVTGQTTAGARVVVRSLSKQVLGRSTANRRGIFKIKTRQTVTTRPVNVVATKARYRTKTWQYTAPLKLTKVKVAGKKITGHTVAGANVQVRNQRQQLLGRVRANRKGNFTVRTRRSVTTTALTVRATKTRYRAASWHYRATLLNVPLIAQRPQLPTGCEITAVTMMLRYKGCHVTKTGLAKEMPRSFDPNKGFVGNPYSRSGWTIYPRGLMKLVKRHAGTAKNLTHARLATLKRQLDRRHPVTVWVTGVDGFNTHALTLSGYSPTRIYYNDPWTNRKASLTTASFMAHWRRDGYRAISY